MIIWNLVLSNTELFYTIYEETEPKDVWTAFDILETNSIDVSKLDNMIFQKSKDFYVLEKRRASDALVCFLRKQM